MIACAFAGPLPFNPSSSSLVAVLTLTAAIAIPHKAKNKLNAKSSRFISDLQLNYQLPGTTRHARSSSTAPKQHMGDAKVTRWREDPCGQLAKSLSTFKSL